MSVNETSSSSSSSSVPQGGNKNLPINLHLTNSLSDVIGFLSPLSQIAVEMIHNTSIMNNEGNKINNNENTTSVGSVVRPRNLSFDRRSSDVNDISPAVNASIMLHTSSNTTNNSNHTAEGGSSTTVALLPTTKNGTTTTTTVHPSNNSPVNIPSSSTVGGTPLIRSLSHSSNGSSSTSQHINNPVNVLRSPLVSPLHPQLSPWLHPHVHNGTFQTSSLSSTAVPMTGNTTAAELLLSPLSSSASVAISSSSSSGGGGLNSTGSNSFHLPSASLNSMHTLPNTQTFALPFARSRYSSVDGSYATYLHDPTEPSTAQHHHHTIGVTPPIPPTSFASGIPPVIREEFSANHNGLLHTEGLANRFPRRHSNIMQGIPSSLPFKEYDEPSSHNTSASLSSAPVSNATTPLILPSPALTIPHTGISSSSSGAYYPSLLSDRSSLWYRRRQSSIATVESVPETPRSDDHKDTNDSNLMNLPYLSRSDSFLRKSIDSGSGRDRSNTLLSTNYYELDSAMNGSNTVNTTTSLLPEISVEAGDIALLGLSRFVAKLANLTGVDLSNSNNTAMNIAPTNSAVISITAEDTAVLGTLVEIIHAVMGYPLLQLGNINGVLAPAVDSSPPLPTMNTANIAETTNTASSSVASSSTLSALDTSLNHHPNENASSSHHSQNIRSLGLGLPMLLMSANNSDGTHQPNVMIPSNTFNTNTMTSSTGRSNDTYSNQTNGSNTGTSLTQRSSNGSMFLADSQFHSTASVAAMKRLNSAQSILDLNRSSTLGNNKELNRRSSRARIALELGKTYAANPSIFDESTREFVESLVTPKNQKSTKNSAAANKLRNVAHTVGKLAVAAKLFSKGVKSTDDKDKLKLHDDFLLSDTTPLSSAEMKLDPLARRLPSVENTVFHGIEDWTWDILKANKEYVRHFQGVNKLSSNTPLSPMAAIHKPLERHDTSNAEHMIHDVLSTLEAVTTTTNITPFSPIAGTNGSSPSQVPSPSSGSTGSSSSSVLPLSLNGPGAEILVAIASYAMEKVGIIDEYRIDSQTLGTFFAHIAKGYRSEQPYHNALHAADVTQALFHLLTRGGLAQHCPCHFRLALLVASACHDVGHPGVNNYYLLATGHPLALTYNDVSPLENMHAATMFLTMRKPGADVLANLAPDTKRSVRQLMIALILATDNGQHFRMVARLRRRFIKAFRMLPNTDTVSTDDNGGNRNDDDDDSDSDSDIEVLEDIDDEVLTEIPIHQPIDLNKPHDSKLILSALLHACDIANPARPWDISNTWNDWVTQEFYSQGDKMRDYGLPVPPMHDRNHQSLSSSNMVAGFMKALVIPLWESLNHRVVQSICRIDPVLNGLQQNFTKHLEIIENAKLENEKQQQNKSQLST